MVLVFYVSVSAPLKLLLVTFKALDGHSATYSTGQLRSSNCKLPFVPKSYIKNFGDGDFSVAVSKLWSSIPNELKQQNPLNIFLKIRTQDFPIQQYLNKLNSFKRRVWGWGGRGALHLILIGGK